MRAVKVRQIAAGDEHVNQQGRVVYEVLEVFETNDGGRQARVRYHDGGEGIRAWLVSQLDSEVSLA